MQKLTITTSDGRHVIDITNDVEILGSELAGEDTGLFHLQALHTTVGLTLGDYDGNGTAQDYLDAFEAIVPHLKYRHQHNPEHMPDHIMSVLIGPTLSIPWKKGKLVLGEWQRVLLFEFAGPRARKINITFVPAK